DGNMPIESFYPMTEKRRKKILLVEDNPADRSMIRKLLESSAENCVIEVSEAEEALKFCDKVQIDGIVLDLHLPGMDGMEFLERLKSIYGGGVWPVVVLTGEGDETTAVEAMKRGAQDYLAKSGITQDKLLMSVASAASRAVEVRIQETELQLLRAENERLKRAIADLDARLSEAEGKLTDALLKIQESTRL
ncbi:MAG: response regulator, partial [Puniceicoccales bacterium]